ncbi:hypothetical protein BGW80DRAFT_1322183 [Lactifluus volemus]|nr:hypothetical protein BGW80DRAFT_1322183 [Lactifluus volemus]
MEIVINGHSINPSLTVGAVLLATLRRQSARYLKEHLLSHVIVNAFLSGIVSQQFYAYWCRGFGDSKRIKVFVVIQYAVVIIQSAALWQLVWSLFIAGYGQPPDPKASTWETLVHAVSQCVLVLSANMFLAIRIYHLTKSRLQTGLAIALSISAFSVAMVNVVTTWTNTLKSSFMGSLYLSTSENITSIVWHVLQAFTECLITFLLARALSKSRSGLQRTDSVVNYLIRRVIQIGFIASLWVVAELVTWFLLPHTTIYTIFNATAGPIYTQVIYDTLLSRDELRKRMGTTESSPVEVIFAPKRASPLPKGPNDPVSMMTSQSWSLSTVQALGLQGTFENDDSDHDVERAPDRQPDTRHELSCSPG